MDGLDAIIPAIASGIVSAVIAAFGCYVAVTNRLTKLETMINTLTRTVDKHNHVIERTYKLERDMETAFIRHDENKERYLDNRRRIEHLEARIGNDTVN